MGMGGSCAIVCLVFTVESGGLFLCCRKSIDSL